MVAVHQKATETKIASQAPAKRAAEGTKTKSKTEPVAVAVQAKATGKEVAAKASPPKTAPTETVPKVSLRAPTKSELVKSKQSAKAKKPAAHAKVVSLVHFSPRLSPPLHDGGAIGESTEHQSDKKFFGPPFPADYPDDKRPVPDKSVLKKLKGPDQPYPALQSKADFDRDYVKDENSDKGSWKAQFEYDELRKKLAKEQADEKRAEERAAKEARDVDNAQG